MSSGTCPDCKGKGWIEMAFRAYDPCFGCATHALAGQMPVEIVFRGLDGSVRETIRRFC